MSGNKKFPRTHTGRLAADMVLRYYTHDVARDSAALTYYLLFAIFPLLIFISTLLGLLELDVAYITSVLEPLLPADVVDVVRSYLEYVSANQSRQLLWFSLIFSIWFPMRASGCLMHSIPTAIVGGVSFVLYGMISAVGVRNVVENRVDLTKSRNLIIAAVIFVCGLGFASTGGITFTVGSADITLTGLAIAALAGVILNAVLPGNDYEFGKSVEGDASADLGSY